MSLSSNEQPRKKKVRKISQRKPRRSKQMELQLLTEDEQLIQDVYSCREKIITEEDRVRFYLAKFNKFKEVLKRFYELNTRIPSYLVRVTGLPNDFLAIFDATNKTHQNMLNKALRRLYFFTNYRKDYKTANFEFIVQNDLIDCMGQYFNEAFSTTNFSAKHMLTVISAEKVARFLSLGNSNVIIEVNYLYGYVPPRVYLNMSNSLSDVKAAIEISYVNHDPYPVAKMIILKGDQQIWSYYGTLSNRSILDFESELIYYIEKNSKKLKTDKPKTK